MSILTEDALEFAKEHIQKYYASDFFPKALEYDALWHSWDEVKSELMSKNIDKFWVLPPVAITSFKPKGTFRVVHQLEPLDAIIYTALTYQVAGDIEGARVPVDQNVACSYRILVEDGSFFASGSGFESYTTKSEELAAQYKHVLVTDITDFYNQIYLHRLNNAIEFASSALKPIADDIEKFLSKLNNKASQGVPVGPASSIIMSEAILIDIDNFIISKGVAHTRYVDDFRIFADDEEILTEVLEELTLYLYENHRLTLSSEKTQITESATYVNEILHNHYELEKIELFKTLEVINPYSGEEEEIEIPIEDDDEKAKEIIETTAEKVLERDYLDLGLSRSLIRKAKTYGDTDLADILFDEFEFFAPVINDLCLYLDRVTDDGFIDEYIDVIRDVIELPIMNRDLIRFWFEWYLSRHERLISDHPIRAFVMNGPNIVNQARAAVTNKDLSWVRNKKGLFVISCGFEHGTCRTGDHVDHGDERFRIAVAPGPCPGGLEETVETFHACIGVG